MQKTTTEDNWIRDKPKKLCFIFCNVQYIYVFILVFLVRKNVIGEDTTLNYWEDLISLRILLPSILFSSETVALYLYHHHRTPQAPQAASHADRR